jgi:phosphoglycolate phosphatase
LPPSYRTNLFRTNSAIEVITSKKAVFLFDIDGTLMSVKREFSRPFLSRCLESAGMANINVNHASFSGRTDRDIFSSLIMEHHPEAGSGELNGLSALYEELKATYIRQLNAELEPGHVEVCEGAREAVEYCIRNGFPVALLTGNYRESAFVKLNRAGLDPYFTHGSFGCDHTDRNKLAEYAAEQSVNWFGEHIEPGHMVVIGDTPRDISCARHAGFRAVAVTTGHFNRQELEGHQPDLLLDGLTNPGQWIPDLLARYNSPV